MNVDDPMMRDVVDEHTQTYAGRDLTLSTHTMELIDQLCHHL